MLGISSVLDSALNVELAKSLLHWGYKSESGNVCRDRSKGCDLSL